MATEINLDVTKLESIHNELSSLDATLINNSLPELQGTIGNIRSNVKSDSINNLLVEIDNRINDIASVLRQELTKLENFIEMQMTGYISANTIAMERIYAVVVRMELIANEINANYVDSVVSSAVAGVAVGATAPSGPSQGTGGNPSQSSPQNQPQAQPQQTPPEQTAPANEKPGFWEYHGQNFANDWDYSGCDAGLDYIVATVDGLCGTVGSVINFVGDGVSEFLGWLFG